jgi:hypothetical protein
MYVTDSLIMFPIFQISKFSLHLHYVAKSLHIYNEPFAVSYESLHSRTWLTIFSVRIYTHNLTDLTEIFSLKFQASNLIVKLVSDDLRHV